MTNPITDEGIGIGKCVAIILEINIIAENMKACDKKLYTFSYSFLPPLSIWYLYCIGYNRLSKRLHNRTSNIQNQLQI